MRPSVRSSRPPFAQRTPRPKAMKYYGREVSRVIGVLRRTLKQLRHLREDYRVKN